MPEQDDGEGRRKEGKEVKDLFRIGGVGNGSLTKRREGRRKEGKEG